MKITCFQPVFAHETGRKTVYFAVRGPERQAVCCVAAPEPRDGLAAPCLKRLDGEGGESAGGQGDAEAGEPFEKAVKWLETAVKWLEKP